jgi:hypothetical protein
MFPAQAGMFPDYQILPEIISRAQVIIQDSAQTLVFIKLKNVLYHAVIKSTPKGDELFLTSFRRTDQAGLDRMRKKGEIIKDELK